MALSHSEVSKIVESILAGDKNQFRIIIHEYELMVRSYLATKLYKQDQVDDLAQETFITAYKKLSAFDTEKSIQSWLFGIAHNHLRNYFKTTKRRTNAMDNFREHIFSSIDEELVQASANVKDEQMASLLHCINKLPDKLSRIIETGLKGLRLDTLETELEMNRNAIYQARYRANELLRKCIQSSCSEEGGLS
ncbi:sigma-70 family RNA polymerase sigma factor [Lentisphaera marina]|uniref:sigma-70 family RNA polymerase sigma factor n=1 Tax=Lentisphaera marina TaxID=1111041 RepID=UPI002366125C|nr:sigma-70 family RNA polymerase sigma factor [Lentisphaera marina]MDD7985084.1 sigma-70 family RNA polymerase sigma factor [Lentisphaera marina]